MKFREGQRNSERLIGLLGSSWNFTESEKFIDHPKSSGNYQELQRIPNEFGLTPEKFMGLLRSSASFRKILNFFKKSRNVQEVF